MNMEMNKELTVYAQWTAEAVEGGNSLNMQSNQFINVWTRVTHFPDILKRQRNGNEYFEKQTGDSHLLIEGYFTDKEAETLFSHFRDSFKVLAQA